MRTRYNRGEDTRRAMVYEDRGSYPPAKECASGEDKPPQHIEADLGSNVRVLDPSKRKEV